MRREPGGIASEQLTLARAVETAPYLLLPRYLPAGYRLSVVQLVEASGVRGATLYFRRRGTEPGGSGIRVHQAAGVGLPPPVEPDVSAVALRGTGGRYSAARNELEWVEGGVYRSVAGSALDLAGLRRVAESLAPPGRETR